MRWILSPARHSERWNTRLLVEIVAASLGGALLLCALAANQNWLSRHFLPAFFLSHSSYVLVESIIRIAAAGLGLVLVFIARRRIGRFVAHDPGRTFQILIAIVLALGATEFILRQLHPRAAMEESPRIEPQRRRDPRLGWVFVPSRTGRHDVGGRVVEYAIDSWGYRVRRIDEPVDPERPTILFTGESMMVGEGLTWDETVPAQVGALLGIQTANLAVSGFASDQAYLRLAEEFPRFRQPMAAVSLFMPAIFDRNLDDDRPHVDESLVWQPARSHWRLAMVAKFLLPYRSQETIERGITVTREVLRASVDSARARGAVPLIVVPQFTPEDQVEHDLRRRVLDDSGLPYVWVELDPSWRIPGNGHPDARAARAIAVAVAAQLRGKLKR